MKRNAPKILAVFLLTAIAVLMVVAGSGSLKEVFGKGNPSNGDYGDAFNEQPQDDLNTGDQNTNFKEPELQQKEPENNYFPINANTNGVYRYEQALTLKELSLNAVHSNSDGIFTIVTHQTKEGAFKVNESSVSVIKSDENGSIVGAVNFNALKPVKYLASAFTSQGLVAVLVDDAKTSLYTVSTDLCKTELIELLPFTNATVYSLNDSFLLIGGNQNNTIYKIKNNAIVTSSLLQAGEVKAVYDFGSYYTLFVSGINGYSVIKLNSDLKLLSSLTVPERELLCIQPTAIEGEQKFTVAELTSTGVEIALYDVGFSLADSTRVGVGLADSAEVFMNENGIFLLLHASTDRLYLIDNQLNFTASNATLFTGIVDFYDCFSRKSGYSVLYSKEGALTITELRNDGTSSSYNLEVVCDTAFVALDKEGNRSVVYAKDDTLKIIGLD